MQSRPPPDLDALRTRVANQAASLAETVTDGFDGFQMGAGGWVVELTAPEGPSTRDGARARQTIRLVPRRRGYAVVVVGTVDPVQAVAEVRTYEHVVLTHETRFVEPLDLTVEEYLDFLSKLDVLLNLARLRHVRVPPPPDLVEDHRRRVAARRPRTSPLAIVVFVVVIALAALVMVRALR